MDFGKVTFGTAVTYQATQISEVDQIDGQHQHASVQHQPLLSIAQVVPTEAVSCCIAQSIRQQKKYPVIWAKETHHENGNILVPNRCNCKGSAWHKAAFLSLNQLLTRVNWCSNMRMSGFCHQFFNVKIVGTFCTRKCSANDQIYLGLTQLLGHLERK